ncbi:acetyl-CoA synthetase-like protein [Fusarium bulbicola]|nr:acetyl-CoA synthetase-like protein [Fusarium bulbicola]
MVSMEDSQQIWSWNKSVPVPAEQCAYTQIVEQVTSHPHRTAICAWDGEATYHQLDHLANKLSHYLLAKGIKAGSLIALCFEKSFWTVVCMLGVLKSGCAFVLLDPKSTQSRLQAIMEQLCSPFVLASKANQAIASPLVSEVLAMVDKRFLDSLHDTMPIAPPPIGPLSAMYVNFTSGSTGAPKGVVVTHRSFASALAHQLEWLGYSATTRLYDFSSSSFDASIANVFFTLSSGGCLCIPSDLDRKDRLGASIQAFRANTIFLPPSVAQLLDPQQVPALDHVVLGGECLHEGDVDRWWGNVQIANIYGPSECTPYSVYNPPTESRKDTCRIGRGIGQVTWVVSPADHKKLVPLGCTGELLLEGPLNANHCLNDQERTTQSFIEPPEWLRRGPQERPIGELYKTGDLVHYNSDGTLT